MLEREDVVAAVRWFRPPSLHATPKEVHAWQWKVFIVIGVLIVSLAGHIAIACGYIAAVYPGFARADTVMEIQVSSLEAQILDTRKSQCSSQGQANLLYTAAIQKLLIKYTDVTSRSYPLPPCEDFR